MKILAVGNSFSQDATAYLQKIMKGGNIIRNCYIGGCDIDTHFKNIFSDEQAYEYQENGLCKQMISLKQALIRHEWDFITVQQVSGLSGLPESYGNLGKLISEIKKFSPNAQIILHRTWCYEPGSDHPDFSSYGCDSKKMFEAIKASTEKISETYKLKIIKTGDLIFRLSNNPKLAKYIYRDGFHLNETYGRFAAALSWNAFFAGDALNAAGFVPENADPEIIDMIISEASLKNAVALDAFAFTAGDISLDKIYSLCSAQFYNKTSPENTITRIGGSEIVFTNKVAIDKSVIDSCPNLKYIGVLATGYNVVDVSYAKQKGITVTNIPAYSTDAVAQQVFAYILFFFSQIERQSRSAHSSWHKCENFCYFPCPTFELAGKTLGVIGYGSIGKRVAQIARAFGMKVLVSTRTRRQDENNIKFVPLKELLNKSDIVSLHCPLFPETENLINSGTIAQMKDGAYLINTSRGAVVDESALAKALCSGKIAGAAADVLSSEPPSADSREENLLARPDCTTTPMMIPQPATGMVMFAA